MVSKIKCYIIFFFLPMTYGQFFHSPIDLSTSGASFSGNLGTHSLQTNPAFLGIKSGDKIAVSPVDTFIISYRVRLIESDDKNKIKQIEANLKRDGLDREYKISKEKDLFVLNAPGFKDSFSAHNYSRNLPSTISNYRIIADTTKEVVFKKKYIYKIQLFATDIKDSLKTFLKRSKPLIKDLKRNVTLNDSMYRFSVGNFEYEQEALIVKDSLIENGLSPDAFIVKEELKSSSLSAPKFSISLFGNNSISLNNNLFSANWFNSYSGIDMVEQPSVKESLLESLPSESADGILITNTSLLDLTYKNFGLSLLNTSLFSNFSLPTSLFEMIFEGLKFDNPIDISELDYKTYVVGSSSLSYGMPIEHESIPFETYIGIGFRYLKGSFSYLDSFSGEILTSTDSITISYEQKIINPDFTLGSGYGIDLGVLCILDEKISGQISFIGLGSSLKNTVLVKYFAQEIKLSNGDIEDFNPDDEAYEVLDSSSYEDISIELPAKLNLGLNYIYSNKVHLKGSIQHLMQTKFIGSVNPRFSLGVELLPKINFTLRAGFSTGGFNQIAEISGSSNTYGIGFGIHLGVFHFDLGMNQIGGIFNNAKGFSIGSDLRLLF